MLQGATTVAPPPTLHKDEKSVQVALTPPSFSIYVMLGRNISGG